MMDKDIKSYIIKEERGDSQILYDLLEWKKDYKVNANA